MDWIIRCVSRHVIATGPFLQIRVTWQWLPVEQERSCQDRRPARVRFSQPPGSVKRYCDNNTADKRVWRGEGCSPESDT
jgi:hypothetical protein